MTFPIYGKIKKCSKPPTSNDPLLTCSAPQFPYMMENKSNVWNHLYIYYIIIIKANWQLLGLLGPSSGSCWVVLLDVKAVWWSPEMNFLGFPGRDSLTYIYIYIYLMCIYNYIMYIYNVYLYIYIFTPLLYINIYMIVVFVYSYSLRHIWQKKWTAPGASPQVPPAVAATFWLADSSARGSRTSNSPKAARFTDFSIETRGFFLHNLHIFNV